jgi:flagellar hook-associated protein 2
MGITPLSFTGVSTFSDDFQTILSRAVSIASIPVKVIQGQQKDLIEKKTLLTTLRTAVESLGSTVSSLGSVGANKAITASSNNTTRVTVSNTGAAVTGSYVISEITSVASAASETSLSGYATADTTSVSGTGTLELVLGGTRIPITLGAEENNLNSLRDAINDLGLGVSASILNTGTGPTPYYLALTATTTGATTLKLNATPGDDQTNLVSNSSQGSNAVFKLNGLSVSQSNNTVSTAIPGVTFTIKSTTGLGETATLTLASDRSQIYNGLSSLVNAYNEVASQVNAQIGTAAGLLSGDALIRQTQSALRSLTTYSSGDGNVQSLANLGIEFDNKGVASFKSSTFTALSDADIAEALTFLGSTTTGFGGLSAAFTQIGDPITGFIRAQQDQYDRTDQRLTEQVDALTDRINLMQSALSQKLQLADTLLASLASQQDILKGSLESLNYVTFGKRSS